MRYLLITNDFYPNNIGGMTHYYTGLAEAFEPDSMVVLTVAADKSTERQMTCRVFRSTVSGSQSGTFFGKRRIRAEAFRIVEKEKIDVVLCGNVRPYGDIAYDIYKTYGLPYHIFFHGNDLMRIMARMDRYILKRIVYSRMLKAARGFIANSRYVMDLIPPQYKNDKSLIVLNPGVAKDFENLSPDPPFKRPESVRLLTVGRLVKRKGISQVIGAVALLRDEYPGLIYDVVGGGDAAPYQVLAKSLGVEDRVFFHGFKSYEDVRHFFKSSDIFIMVSHSSDKEKEVEGFGIVYLEANAYGKPVIGSATGGIEDAVLDGQTGLLVKNPFNEQEIAEKISWLCNHKVDAAAMGLSGHKRVNEQFTYGMLAEKLRKLTALKNKP